MITRTWRITLTSLLAVGIIGGGTVAAVAQDGDTTTPSETTATVDTARDRMEQFVADVAAELGITADELDTAVRTVVIDRIEQAEADGKLTAEQADTLTAAVEDGTVGELVREKLADRDVRSPGLRRGLLRHRFAG